jgi:hypothetical protein
MEEPADTEVEELVERPDWEGRAQLFLSLVIGVFVLILAVPLLVIFLIKSPQTWQDVSLAGISFQKLLFLFLLSAAITAYSGVFFLKAKPLAILIVFVLSLFCCFPLIVGLKNNLTLHHAITDGPFFLSWPFFLRPAYILLELLIPVAIAVYLYLQIKAIISRRPHRYAFFMTAVYLMIAAFFGFLALHQASQPNIYSSLARLMDPGIGVVSAEKRQFPIPKVESHTGQQDAPLAPLPAQVAMNEPAATGPGPVGFEKKLQVLTEKVDRILELLGREEYLQNGASGQVSETAEVSETRAAKHQPPAPSDPDSDTLPADPVQPTETASVPNIPIEDTFTPKVREASDKVDRILETLTQVEKLIPANPDNSQGGKVIIRDKQPAEPTLPLAPPRPPADQRDKEDINGRIQAISDKMDRILEALAKMESRLSGQ